ncbi:9159_t:CDS:2 [Gigaspora margarita]|uniref:9159_t:CDS:1 n=1 Tax=Gigaspora margarita TaxID=4874 RepID=A0ABN7VC95_GIGMA|nr:9159_t:CDS:2 [Gigaspora margarita]
MLKANNKKIDINNLNLDRSYTLEEFEFINDQLKTRTLEIDGQPVNLFDLDKNGKLIPMPQSLYSREIVVAEIVRQLGEGITSSQGGFDFDVGCGRMIRAPDIAYTPKEIYRLLNEKQNWSFHSKPFTPVFVVEIGNISSYSKFEKLDRKFKDIYFAEGTSVQLGWLIDPENKEIHNVVGGDFLPRFILEIWKIEHAISQRESVSPEPTENNKPHNCPYCLETLTSVYNMMKHIESNHTYKRRRTDYKNCENAQITDKSKTWDIVSSSSHQEVTSEQIDNTISNIYYLNGTCFGESESLEEKTKTSLLHNAKTVAKCHDQNYTIDNFDTTSEMLESDNQIIEGLIQEITFN